MITAQYLLKVSISNTVLLPALLLFMQRLHTGAGPAVTSASNGESSCQQLCHRGGKLEPCDKIIPDFSMFFDILPIC